MVRVPDFLCLPKRPRGRFFFFSAPSCLPKPPIARAFDRPLPIDTPPAPCYVRALFLALAKWGKVSAPDAPIDSGDVRYVVQEAQEDEEIAWPLGPDRSGPRVAYWGVAKLVRHRILVPTFPRFESWRPNQVD